VLPRRGRLRSRFVCDTLLRRVARANSDKYARLARELNIKAN
jgi:hypothetical protein